MPPLLYADCLDTVRNDLAPEPAVLTLAQVKMQLVLGYTLCLSQTQAFDSVHVFDYVKDSAFCDLVRQGAIRIILRQGVPGPAQALAEKVGDPAFHLCAWPEIEHSLDGTDDSEQRPRSEVAQEMIEAARGRLPLPGSGPLEERWEELLTLDAAYREAGLRRAHLVWDPKDSRSTMTLGGEIVAARDAEPTDTELHHGLAQLAALGGNQRSRYYRHIHHDLQGIGEEVKADLHSIVNLSYNRIVAESLRSEPGLSTYSSAAKSVVEARLDGVSESERSPVIELELLNTRKLEHLSWQTVLELRKIMQHERWSAARKWDMLKERSVLAASEILLADGTAQRVISMVPTVDNVISGALTLAAGALLGGPDAGAISAVFYYQVKERLDPVQWLQKKLAASYRRNHQEAVIALLRKGLGRAHHTTVGAHA